MVQHDCQQSKEANDYACGQGAFPVPCRPAEPVSSWNEPVAPIIKPIDPSTLPFPHVLLLPVRLAGEDTGIDYGKDGRDDRGAYKHGDLRYRLSE